MLENNGSVNYCISGAIIKALYEDFNKILSPKEFYFAVNNFLSFGSFGLKDSKEIYSSSADGEKRGIKDVLLKIIIYNDQFSKEVKSGKRKKSKYILPFAYNKLWGKEILAFFADFAEVKI